MNNQTHTPKWPTAIIRKLLGAAFSDEELSSLCFDHFAPVHEQFGSGMSKVQKIQHLIKHCQQHRALDQLLALVRRHNPSQFAHFESQITQPIDPPQGRTDLPIHQYLQTVRDRCTRLETRPYHQLSQLPNTPPRLSLLDEGEQSGVYVPLSFDLHLSQASLKEIVSDQKTHPETNHDLSWVDFSLDEVLTAPGHIVFIGPAGCGKTTLLRLVAALLAHLDPSLARDQLALGDEPHPTPIFLALRDLEHACQTEPEKYRRDLEGLLRFLDDHFQRWRPGCVPHGFLSDQVRAGRAWLLLDALDEVANFDHRIAVRQLIEQLAGAFPGNRLLVTARVAAYANANARLNERFHLATVRALTRDQWSQMITRLYVGLETNPNTATERAQHLTRQIDGSPVLQEMVKTPLAVWTAAIIHHAGRELPEQRAELYGAYVDVLLGERLKEAENAQAAQRLRSERWPLEDRRLYLTYAAHWAHRGAEGINADPNPNILVVVDEHDLVHHILAPFMANYLGLAQRQAKREAADFVALMAERSGLLHAHQDGYSFGDHLTVQEFLAARYLVDNLRGSDEWGIFLRERVGQSWWREVFLLMAGYLLQWPQQARRFLLDELGALPEGTDASTYALAWAGRALLEIPPCRVGWHDRVRAELARRLARVLENNPPTTSVAARIEAGHVLGQLGDPRFQGTLSLPEFISIPGGTFWMGSDEGQVQKLVREIGENWFRNESPRHHVALGDFALACYPTTNAMFAHFIDSGGYADQRWWAKAQADGIWRPDGALREWRGKRRQPVHWDDARFNNPNQPVVGVTWYEAVAYCQWLTAMLNDGHVYRLPSEAEWERAARGPSEQTRPYPWGNDWLANHANTQELAPERTNPVGVFPDGASAEGVLDMAGGVWEWCDDWFDADTYRRRAGRLARNPTGPEEGSAKVLRGGSWRDGRHVVRCARRYEGIPIIRIDYGGFRVARQRLG